MKGKASTPEEAQRIARVVASDILMYNKKKIREGILKDSLFDLISKEIEEGKHYFLSRLDSTLIDPLVYFNEALIEFLLKTNEDCKKAKWL
ncbi:hypothetical protein KAH37_00830 [bacterium]|nr:hypothetical protein [bacterium]